MDKSVAQKLMIVMSLLTAMFATVFVCGSIVSSSISTDGYIQPVPKTHYIVTYSDTSIYDDPDQIISQSDADYPVEITSAASTTIIRQNYSHVENGVTVVEFVDDDDYTSETINVVEEDIDNQFLYMTTVTTKLPNAAVKGSLATTTIKHTTTKTTRKTTRKTSAVTSAKPYTTKNSTSRTTFIKKTTTTEKKTATTKIQTQSSKTSAVMSAETTTSITTATTTSARSSTTTTSTAVKSATETTSTAVKSATETTSTAARSATETTSTAERSAATTTSTTAAKTAKSTTTTTTTAATTTKKSVQTLDSSSDDA